MNNEVKFKTDKEERKFKIQLAEMLLNEELELIPSHNLEANSYNFLHSSVYRNKKTTEYFKLKSSYHESEKGSWLKVREIITEEPLEVRANYLFKAQRGGNFGYAGRIVLKLKQISENSDLKVDIRYQDDNLNRYVKSSVDFGLMYAIDTINPYKKLLGHYNILVEQVGFHDIDSSTITIAYAANMALRRAFDKEINSNSFLFESGRFSLYKKTPTHKAYE